MMAITQYNQKHVLNVRLVNIGMEYHAAQVILITANRNIIGMQNRKVVNQILRNAVQTNIGMEHNVLVIILTIE
jgi:hypothetical protein